ncbi:unnamed protein product, partial [Oppiella nova]
VLQVIYAKPDISGDIPGADKSIGGQIVGNVVNPRGNGCNGPLDRNEAVCVKHCTDIGFSKGFCDLTYDISGDIPGADKSIGGQIVGNVVNPRGNGCNGPLDRNEAVCVKHCTDIGFSKGFCDLTYVTDRQVVTRIEEMSNESKDSSSGSSAPTESSTGATPGEQNTGANAAQRTQPVAPQTPVMANEQPVFPPQDFWFAPHMTAPPVDPYRERIRENWRRRSREYRRRQRLRRLRNLRRLERLRRERQRGRSGRGSRQRSRSRSRRRLR